MCLAFRREKIVNNSVGVLTIVDFDATFPGATVGGLRLKSIIVRLFSLKEVSVEITGHRESAHDASIEFEDTVVSKPVSKFAQAQRWLRITFYLTYHYSNPGDWRTCQNFKFCWMLIKIIDTHNYWALWKPARNYLVNVWLGSYMLTQMTVVIDMKLVIRPVAMTHKVSKYSMQRNPPRYHSRIVIAMSLSINRIVLQRKRSET